MTVTGQNAKRKNRWSFFFGLLLLDRLFKCSKKWKVKSEKVRGVRWEKEDGHKSVASLAVATASLDAAIIQCHCQLLPPPCHCHLPPPPGQCHWLLQSSATMIWSGATDEQQYKNNGDIGPTSPTTLNKWSLSIKISLPIIFALLSTILNGNMTFLRHFFLDRNEYYSSGIEGSM